MKASLPVCSMGKICTHRFDFTADLCHSLALQRPLQKGHQFSGEAEVTGLRCRAVMAASQLRCGS